MANLKENIELVILESYKKSKQRNFSDLNYVFPGNTSVIAYLKGKIKIFNNLDEYSQTFLSIHTRAKIALREFKSDLFEGSYLELLRLILTLPEELGYGKLKSTGFQIKEEAEALNTDRYVVGQNITQIIPVSKIRENTVLIQQGVTGKKLEKQKIERELEIEELNAIDWEDNEYKQKEFNKDEYSDIQI